MQAKLFLVGRLVDRKNENTSTGAETGGNVSIGHSSALLQKCTVLYSETVSPSYLYYGAVPCPFSQRHAHRLLS